MAKQMDPRALRPAELVRLLNSTPLGPVLDERRLRAHRRRAGLRIGDGATVDLVRYVAWLADQEHATPAPAGGDSAGISPETATTAYDRKKLRERERNAAASRQGREIGPLPAPADPARRAAAAADFRQFCESYFPSRFSLAWSADHLAVIAKIEEAVLRGGLFAMALPRGFGKTTLCEVACIWATLTGARRFVVLIGASAQGAEESLDAIKTELETNALLAADWPDMCYPLARLEGRANLAAGQTLGGQRTRITWGKRCLVLPTVDGAPGSGAVLRVAGITGRVRGMKHTRADGSTVRPDFVIVDDPQTDQSAKSAFQCDTRERILAGAVLGLAGPRVKIAGVMPCTVVRRGDLADRLLDRAIHPEWTGYRCRLLRKMPADLGLWEQYREIRAAGLRADDGGRAGNAFYAAHRDAMDAGAEVAWPERFNADELSALQNCMNLKLQDEHAFACEYQNEPPLEAGAGLATLSAEQLAGGRVNGLARGVVPLTATRLTLFVDVQHTLLYWVLAAWADDFTGAVVDYGTWPEQGLPYFTLRTAPRTLAQAGHNVPAAVLAGLGQVAAKLMDREWRREGGGGLRVDRCLVDAKDGALTETVHAFCRTSQWAARLYPSGGRGLGPTDRPLAAYTLRPGDRAGDHWLLQRSARWATRAVTVDTNFWKSFTADRLATPLGDRGALTIFGQPGHTWHRMLADHLTAETRDRVRSDKTGRSVDVWRLRPGADNHWLDCVVGCAVAASIEGAQLVPGLAPPKRRRITQADVPGRKHR